MLTQRAIRLRRSLPATGLVLALAALALAAQPPRRAAGAAVPSAPAWVLRPSSGTPPPARSQFGLTIDPHGILYTYGGRGPDGAALDDFWRLRPSSRTWERLPNTLVPALVEPHLTADARGDIFEFGGIADADEPGHFSADRHSYGLYEWLPAQGDWIDLTPATPHLNRDWPPPREDHGFAYEPASGRIFVFAGEGAGSVSLNDMWRYDERAAGWSRVVQRFSAPGGIDAREIYNITPDGRGGIYLFGGAYLFGADGKPVRWRYVNDLWRFDVASATWRLIAGQPNAYDPSMPLPRHYYGQASDAQGDLYVLGGYASDTQSPPYFASDDTTLYAQLTVFSLQDVPTGNIMYALDDFWQWNAAQRRWVDLTGEIGDLQGSGFIPYVMVFSPLTAQLLTFAGFHPDADDELQASAGLYAYGVPAPATTPTTALAAPRVTIIPAAPSPAATPDTTAVVTPPRLN